MTAGLALSPQASRELRELLFWQTDAHEKPGARSLDNLVNKAREAALFLVEVEPYRKMFEGARSVLELGGGQCWASCIVKRINPAAHVIGSDISAEAVHSAGEWERVYDVQLDGSLACRSYSVDLASGSLDLIFAFQAAHHFGDHAATFKEAFRLLRPGGSLFYLYEPSCSRLLYRMAYKRVNAIRDVVQEDLLIPSDMRMLSEAAGFEFSMAYRLNLAKLGWKRATYYRLLQSIPALARLLPASADFIFTKPRHT